jgi:hypothetical protein
MAALRSEKEGDEIAVRNVMRDGLEALRRTFRQDGTSEFLGGTP